MTGFDESLHDEAYAVVLAAWRRQLSRFALIELPRALLLLLVATNSQFLLSPIAAIPAWGVRGASCAALAYLVWLWINRLPPERPRRYDPVVLSQVDQMTSVRHPSLPHHGVPAP